MISVTACKSKRDFKLFERIPELLHRDERNFVPPFPGTVASFLETNHPFHSRGEILPFIAWKSGRPAGRVAAIVNRAHNEYQNDRVGFLGFFDFADDISVAQHLFETAQQEIEKRGLESIRGPYNPTSNDECGLLIDGFELPPFVMMPYNPQYYVDHYGELGLNKIRDLHSYHIGDAEQGLERTQRIVERLTRKANITVRSANMSKLDDEVRILHSLYNATLGKQWGFVPISTEDLEFSMKDLRQVLDPEMVLIAEKDGQPIGISVTIPNINEFMLMAKGSRGLIRTLRFLWYLKTRRPTEARLAILGVLPEHRRRGVAPAFYFESLQRGRKKYVGGEIGWVLDNNDEVNKAAELMGATRYKTYGIFEKTI